MPHSPPSPPHYSSIIPPVAVASTAHSNGSSYTLATIPVDLETASYRSEHSYLLEGSRRRPSDSTTPLSDDPSSSSTTYGTATLPENQSLWASRRVLFNAALKMAILFVVSTAVLSGTLWLALPPIEEDDRPFLRIPKSFDQLKDLNYLLQKYRTIYPFRVVLCYVTTYLFLQAFSLPGSMYLSILGGAVWGVPIALPLACSCVATGATLCYFISAALGPALLVLPKWKARLDTWSTRLSTQRSNLFSYLIVLRIAPFPPHWVVNVIAPHVGIGVVPFWCSTWLGIFGVTVIHTTIGSGLDEMTGPEDFHLISWRNFLGLSAVVVGVLIPVGLRYVFRSQVDEVVRTEEGVIALGEDVDIEGEGSRDGEEDEDEILEQGPPVIGSSKKGKKSKSQAQQSLLVLLSDSEGEDEHGGFYHDDDDEELLRGGAEDEDEDEILESGPEVIIKGKHGLNGFTSSNGLGFSSRFGRFGFGQRQQQGQGRGRDNLEETTMMTAATFEPYRDEPEESESYRNSDELGRARDTNTR